MSRLQVFAADDPACALIETDDGDAIAAQLSEIGVIFERWPTRIVTTDVLNAYAPEIALLKSRGGYRSVDVVAVTPGHPDRAAFLAEVEALPRLVEVRRGLGDPVDHHARKANADPVELAERLDQRPQRAQDRVGRRRAGRLDARAFGDRSALGAEDQRLEAGAADVDGQRARAGVGLGRCNANGA